MNNYILQSQHLGLTYRGDGRGGGRCFFKSFRNWNRGCLINNVHSNIIFFIDVVDSLF